MLIMMFLVQIQKPTLRPRNVVCSSIEELTKCLSGLDSEEVALVSKVVKYE